MQTFVKIATLAMVGTALQGCGGFVGKLMNQLNHHATAFSACTESLENKAAADHQKWVNKLGGGDNETAECVKANLKALLLNDTLNCHADIINKTVNASDLDAKPDEKEIKTKADAWAEENYKDPLEGNTTLQNKVKSCSFETGPQEKYIMDTSGVKFDDQKAMATNANLNAYIVAAGVGMLLAGILYRHASKRTDMDPEQESVMLE